ncbi:MAG: TrkH family potassium uptake protein [Acidobacteriota bacterium]
MAKIKKHEGLSPSQFILLGFALVIIIGAILLTLPFSVRSGGFNNFIDALFTATTAVCVTGLVTVDTGTFYNSTGHAIILLLIQVGGLGIITATTFYAIIIGKRIGLKERLMIKEALNRDELGGVVRLVRGILLTTFVIEGTGAVLLFFSFLKYFPAKKAAWYGIFHSISSFCNAGIDLLGKDYYPYCSLIPLQTNKFLLLVIAFLIILGGIGFPVIIEVLNQRRFKRLSLHSKLALITSAVFLILGTVFFFFSEHGATFSKMGMGDQINNAFFLSTTPRTAGYTAVDLAKSLPATWLVLMFLMFVGASPGGTGGGIKTTTFAVLLMAVWTRMKGKEEVEAFHRRIDKDTIYRALTVLALAAAVLFICILLLTLFDAHDPIKLMFEAFSAFGTVGLTTGITPELTWGAKLVLIFLMFFGRLGPLTMAFALMEDTKKHHIKYPQGSVIIG